MLTCTEVYNKINEVLLKLFRFICHYYIIRFLSLISCYCLFTVQWIFPLISQPKLCMSLSMSLCYPSRSGCLMLRLVCTLTPAEVWSASWSKGTKTKLQHLNLCAPFGWQAAAHSSTRRWQALTWIQAGFPGGNQLECRDASVTGDPVHWGFLTFHSPLSHTHTWGGAASLSVCF